MLYDLATEEQRRILETVYEVSPFNIQTITMERIFVDKLFAAEAYVRSPLLSIVPLRRPSTYMIWLYYRTTPKSNF